MPILLKQMRMAAEDCNLFESINYMRRVMVWDETLGEEYRLEQVAYAIKIHMQESDKFPTQSSLRKILNPQGSKVTYAEYEEAIRKLRNDDSPAEQRHIIAEWQRQKAEKDNRASDIKFQITARGEGEEAEKAKAILEARAERAKLLAGNIKRIEA